VGLIEKGAAGSWMLSDRGPRMLAGTDVEVTSCCCPLIPLAVSIDDASGKIAVKHIQKGIEAKSPRWTMLRFGNGQAARCSLILLARWPCPSIPLMRHSSIFQKIQSYPK
jgi:hypothetical protein